MAVREPFLVNPPNTLPVLIGGKKRKKRSKKSSVSSIISHLGTKGFKLPRRKKVSTKKLGAIGTRHAVAAYVGHGGGLYTSPKARIVRQGIKLNPFGEMAAIVGANPPRRKAIRRGVKHVIYRRNPEFSLAGLDIMSALKSGAGIGSGLILTNYLSKLIGMSNKYAQAGAKVGIGIGGGILIESVNLGSDVAEAFAGTGIVLGLFDLIEAISPGLISGIVGKTGLGDADVLYGAPNPYIGAYPDIGAMPQEIGAMPQELDGIEEEEEVSGAEDEEMPAYGGSPYED